VQIVLSSILLYKYIKLKYTNTFSLLFCVGVKLGRSHCGRNVDWGVFENRVLRRIFGPKRDEVTGERRKLPNEF